MNEYLDRMRSTDVEKWAPIFAAMIWWFTGLVCILVGAYLLWGWYGWLFTLGLYITLGIMYNTFIEVLKARRPKL